MALSVVGQIPDLGIYQLEITNEATGPASMAALDAVIHPADTEALYFVARGNGSHEFSATLEAHNRAVAKYQLHRQ